MRRSIVVLMLALALAVVGGGVAWAAEEVEAESVAAAEVDAEDVVEEVAADVAPEQGGAASAEDKTGTNPVNFQSEMRLFNVFTELPDGAGYINEMRYRQVWPFDNRRQQIRLEIPLVTTNVTGETEFGFGDLLVRWLMVTKATPKNAVAVGVESTWDTATSDVLGTGKNVLAPVVFYVIFLPEKKAIFAPGYQYRFDIGGSDARADVSLSAIDLYYVLLPKPGSMIDPQIIIDHESSTTYVQVETEFGRMMGPGWSTYLRPGFPIGGNRLMDWNLEFGIKSVF
jgi:hypothetical protein